MKRLGFQTIQSCDLGLQSSPNFRNIAHNPLDESRGTANNSIQKAINRREMSTPNRMHLFWWLNVFSRNKTEKDANAGRNRVSRPDGASTNDLIVGPCRNSFPLFPRLLPVSHHSSTFLRCHQSFCDLQIRSRPGVVLSNSPARFPRPFGPVFSMTEQ